MTAIKQPNNLRNRYRRMRAAWRAYNWAGAPSLRDWAKWASPDSSSAPKFEEGFEYLIGKEESST